MTPEQIAMIQQGFQLPQNYTPADGGMSDLAYDSGQPMPTRAPAANPLSPMAAPAPSPLGIPSVASGGGSPPAVAAAPTNPAARLRGAMGSLPMIRENMNVPPDALARLKALLDKQQGGVDLQNELVKQAGTVPVQSNLAPLLAMIDAQTGSKLSESYKQPETPQERADKMVKLQNVALGDQLGLTKDVTSVLNSGNKDESKILTALLAMAGKDRSGAAAAGASKADSDLGNHLLTLTSRGANKSYGEAIRRGENIDNLLKRYPNLDDMPGIQVALTAQEIDGLVNGGAPTIVGAQGIIPDSYKAKWNSLMSKVEGKPTAAELGDFLKEFKPYVSDVIQIARNHLRKQSSNLLGSYTSRLGGENSEPVQRYKKQIDEDYGSAAGTAQEQTAAPSASTTATPGGPAPASISSPGEIKYSKGVPYQYNPALKRWDKVKNAAQ